LEISFYLEGEEEAVTKEYYVRPNSRDTIYIPDYIGRPWSHSTSVKSDKEVIVERPMYFYKADLDCEGGFCVMGMTK
jgi:hypothetical protein